LVGYIYADLILVHFWEKDNELKMGKKKGTKVSLIREIREIRDDLWMCENKAPHL
jgi:hypothetical protein